MAARILIIEDNEANLELMSYLLCAFGHTVVTARDGESGLALARAERSDLVLCDIQLPRLNGMEIARSIRSDAALDRIPLIAVTAYAMVGDRESIMTAGFNGYFSKPIAPETFVQQVEAFLRPELRGAATSAPSATAAVAPTTREGRTILVVDDKQDNLDLAVGLLRPSGFRVVTAMAMRTALALARDSRPDLIISDVCMADGSGYDFIRKVKADPALRAVPFIFITSTMTAETERAKGLALGAARYLFRPLEPQLLLTEIESCLREESRG